MAELVDAHVSEACVLRAYGFDSHLRHSLISNLRVAFFLPLTQQAICLIAQIALPLLQAPVRSFTQWAAQASQPEHALNHISHFLKKQFLMFSRTVFTCLAFVVGLLSTSSLWAQAEKPLITQAPKGHARKGDMQQATLIGEGRPSNLLPDWQPLLITHGSHNPAKDRTALNAIKAQQALRRQLAPALEGEQPESSPQLTIDLSVNRNFAGNNFNGCPPDNTLAISNGGYIISCVNSNVAVFNQNGQMLQQTNLYDFFNNSSVPDNLCDPKVIYDSQADRFILFSQVCDGLSDNSRLMIAFSQTNNPLNSWWIYTIDGNPLNNGTWFDYPKMAVSAQELVISGNLFTEGGEFNQAIVYQINKTQGYAGGNLGWQYWFDLDGNPFTVLPLGWGYQGSYGPGIYMVSAESGGGSVLHFYDLTDYASATNEQINHYEINVDAYEPPAAANQPGAGLNLDTGDSRMMDGFYVSGKVFLVHTASQDGWGAIRVGRIGLPNLEFTYTTTHAAGEKDYTYASIAPLNALTNTDPSVLVSFLASGPNTYPEIRAKAFEPGFLSQASISVRQGDGYVEDWCYQEEREYIRWGDYSGLSRKHNASSPSLWVAGCYGESNGDWQTWIAEINANLQVGSTEPNSPVQQISIAPNPVQERFAIHLDLSETTQARFELFDQQGRLVALLYEGRLTAGANTFSFLQSHWPAGTYFLNIRSQSGQTIAHEKVVILP